jgi:hypothetical protein
MDDGWISKKKSTEWLSMVSKDNFKLAPESFAPAFDLRVCWHGNKPFVSKPERTPNQTDQNGTSPNGPIIGAKATGGEAEDGNRQFRSYYSPCASFVGRADTKRNQLSKEIPT